MKRRPPSRSPARRSAKLWTWLAGRRASIMVITALSAPLLVAATGLAVDVSYMYQEQVALQAAADAAALAVSNAAAKYGVATQADATAFATTGAGPYFAVAAANNATQNSFNFAKTGNASVSVATPSSSSGTNGTIWTWSATAQAPRGSFFSPVQGLGLTGLTPGLQAAGATADYVPASSPLCFIATTEDSGTGMVTNSNQGSLQGSNCNLYAGAATGCPFNENTSANGGFHGGFIYGAAIDVPTVSHESQSCVPNGGAKAYIGPTSSLVSNTDIVTGITAMSTPPADLVTLGGTPPTGANQIAKAQTNPATPTGLTTESSPSSLYASDSNPLYLPVGYEFTGGTSSVSATSGLYVGTTGDSATLSTAGTSYMTTGLSSNGARLGNVAFGGAEDFISDTSSPGFALDLQFGNPATSSMTTFAAGSGTLVVDGLTSLQQNGAAPINTTITLGAGTYYFNGQYNGASVSSTCTSAPAAFCIDANNGSGSTLSFSTTANSVYLVNGSFGFTNEIAGDVNNFADGTYVFNGLVSISGAGTTTFGSASGTQTYWFNNGLSVTNNAHVTFNPGIYYFLGGTMYLDDSTITANGATFIFEGSANYVITNQGASFSMSAPTTNCVAPGSYPVATDSDGTGYEDGTGGEGICGVLFYQVPSDTAFDSLENNVTTPPLYLDGIIFQPGAELTLGAYGSPGNETAEAPSGGYLEVEVASLVDYGQSTLIVSKGSGGNASSISMLVR